MGKVRKARCGYEYVSDNGIVYGIGEYGAEFNIIVDDFSDLWDEYEEKIGFHSQLVDYVYGDIEDEDVIEWLDWRIERYENHERVAKFGCYECYVGLQEENRLQRERVSKDEIITKTIW